MFSGIVESVQDILAVEPHEGLLRFWVRRPPEFQDLHLGDSVAVNGVCLTIESFAEDRIQFAMAAETLRVLKLDQNPLELQKQKLNLERSLRFGDRIHGHLVSGHVDSVGRVTSSWKQGESLFLEVELPESVVPYCWKKGSVTLHGVSLTINELDAESKQIQVCLIPETQKRTNLASLKKGDPIHVEPDWIAKALHQAFQTQIQAGLRKEGT